MADSPYAGRPESDWLRITEELIKAHPLKSSALLEVAMTAWNTLWHTTVGTGAIAVGLSDLKVPASIVGYFFEVLLARELERREPEHWRGTRSKNEKDLVYLPNPELSVEIKTSGQSGYKVYGNRSYGQKFIDDLGTRKEKSGYYVTVNFCDRALTLLRFGWIDADDWQPQKAPTGQMAGLRSGVYDHKLVPIPGRYRQLAPVFLLDGVGPTTASQFSDLGIKTIADLLAFPDELPGRLSRIRERNHRFLSGCYDP